MTVVNLESDEVADAGKCASVSDVFRPHARRLVGRVLRQYLDELMLTATELMSASPYIERLNANSQASQRAIQLISGAQARVFNMDLHKRMRVLIQIGEKLKEVVETTEKAVGRPDVQPGQVGALLEKVRGTPGVDNVDVGMCIALTFHLSEANGWEEKLSRLVGLAAAEAPGPAVEFIDCFIADILESSTALKAIFGSIDTLGDRLMELIWLHNSKWPEKLPFQPQQTVLSLDQALRKHELPLTRLTIRQQIQRSLEVGVPVSRTAGFGELLRLCDLHEQLRLPDGQMLCGERASIAIEKRMSRQIEPENLAPLLDSKPTIAGKIEAVLQLQKRIVGVNNKKQIGELVRLLAEKREFTDQLLAGSESASAKLKGIADLYDQIMGSEMADSLKERIGKQLEEVQMKFIKDNKIFAKINQSAKNVSETVIKLLDLCRNGLFTKGQNRLYVHSLIKHQLNQSDFMKAYMAGATSEEARRQRLAELKKRMREAGLDDVAKPAATAVDAA
ncbi:MAG: hypothetical protein JNK11_01820 [Alphaproteobacteria bacterium]|nr:hypothetical protein [Alphaproteobacteria bacterium]